MALNANGELVVANGDRSLMAVLFHSEEDGLFVVHLYDDPVAMIDPDAEATDGSCHETVAAAFDAATDLIGCAIGRQPSPTA
jgi:hypothetical protein